MRPGSGFTDVAAWGISAAPDAVARKLLRLGLDFMTVTVDSILIPAMYLTILAHPIFVNLNFHMPMIVDLSHPLIMLQGANWSGKSTLLHSIYFALRGETPDGYVYRLDRGSVDLKKVFLF